MAYSSGSGRAQATLTKGLQLAKRRGIWLPLNSGATVAASGTGQVDMLTNLPDDLDSHGGLTVSRIIGEWAFRCDTIATFQQFSAGVTVHNAAVTAANLGSQLIASVSEDWMYQLHTATGGFFSEAAAGDFDGVFQYRPLDIKVQRKLGNLDELSFILRVGAGQSVTFNLGARIYVKLP